ncbi:hypothetical protein OpiT1DRAFT_01276 [Opitutaceae bacterium TAV1]|nr:hypothetical protein OpiT1DRAFT_01276 [Opitutaceae bacterium TAV1]
MDNKTLSDLTPAEVKKREQLTAKESKAIADFVAAARKLPNSICLDVDYEGLHIMKRVTRGYAQGVHTIRRRSFEF